MGRFFLAFLFFALLAPKVSLAYVRTVASSGIPLYWPNPSLNLALNPANASGLSNAQVANLIDGAFSSWHSADSSISYSLSSSTSYPTNGAQNGINEIFFSSHAPNSLDYGVVALTRVLYYPSNGQLVQFDMQFNDQQFLFTSNPGDTGKLINGQTAIYLQDVATHEAGHAFGFDHSTVERSTLVYSAFSGQFNLGDDDITAINTVYPSSGGKGSISGSVEGLSGGVFGAHVIAVNQSTGHVQAGTLANPDGSFTIGDIPAGDYVVMMEPLETSTSTISSYYQNVNHAFCGASKFKRSFYGACGSGVATTVNVQAGAGTSIGTLSPTCSQMGNPAGAPTSLGSAKLYNSSGGAMFGTLVNGGDTHYYKIPGVSGNLSAIAMSYTLYSPADVVVDILHSDGSAVAGASSTDNVENPMPGGHINFDSSASVSGLSSGDYIIRVRSNTLSLPAYDYPAGYSMLDSSAHYLLLVSVNGNHGVATTTDMSACISLNNVAQSSNRTPASDGSSKTQSGGGCGMIQGSGAGPGGPASSIWESSLTLILLTAIATKLAQALARRRS